MAALALQPACGGECRDGASAAAQAAGQDAATRGPCHPLPAPAKVHQGILHARQVSGANLLLTFL